MSDEDGPPPMDEVGIDDDEPKVEEPEAEIDLGGDFDEPDDDVADNEPEPEAEEEEEEEEEEETAPEQQPEQKVEEEVAEAAPETEASANDDDTAVADEEESPTPQAEAAAEKESAKTEVAAKKGGSIKRVSHSAQAPIVPQHSFTVQVGDPEKIAEGSYVVYKVTAKTNLKAYKKRELSVNRRFSDFHSLQKNLSNKYPGVIVPPCPPKDAVGTFSLKMANKEATGSSFIERRQFGLERFLRRLVMHPILVTDEMVRMFFETDQKIPKPPSSIFNSITKSVSTYFETDEFFDDRWRQMEVLEGQLKRLHRAVESLVHVRKTLSMDTTNFAKTFAALADAEELKALTQAMHQLADVEAKVAKFHMKQSGRDYFEFSESVYDYIALVGSAKVALGQRQDVNREFINAVASLDSKKKKLASIEADPNKIIKVEPAKADVKDAEQRVADSQLKVAEISRLLRRELERFDHFKAQDFISMCVKYIESVMTMEHQIVKAWEAFLPEAKSIPL